MFERLACKLLSSDFHLHLRSKARARDCLHNWERINQHILVTHLNAEFYLLPCTVTQLALGEDEEVIIRVLKALFGSLQARNPTGFKSIVNLPKSTLKGKGKAGVKTRATVRSAS